MIEFKGKRKEIIKQFQGCHIDEKNDEFICFIYHSDELPEIKKRDRFGINRSSDR